MTLDSISVLAGVHRRHNRTFVSASRHLAHQCGVLCTDRTVFPPLGSTVSSADMNDTISLRVQKEKSFEEVETLAKMHKFSNALVSGIPTTNSHTTTANA